MGILSIENNIIKQVNFVTESQQGPNMAIFNIWIFSNSICDNSVCFLGKFSDKPIKEWSFLPFVF